MPVILVVDDDPSVRALLEVSLMDLGDIVSAADGDEAWEQVQRQRPDVAVIDISMPGRDGMTLLSSWRADESTADLPVIMLTGDEATEQRVEGYRTGADAYLIKPFEPEALVALVETLLSREPDEHTDMMQVLQRLAQID